MSIITEKKFSANLDSGVVMTPLSNAFMTGDQEAHRFVVSCYRSGNRQAVDLTGAGVQGYFIRADGSTVALEGEITGNAVSVTLPAASYARQGRFSLIIKVSLGEVIHTVFWGEGAMTRSHTDAIIDPGEVIPTLDELLAKIDAMEQATEAANAVANMTAEAQTLPAGSAATASYANGKLTLGIPKGQNGDSGLPAGGEPYQQLVTDGDGNAAWADRLAYEGGSVEILPETVLQGSDDDGDGVNDIFWLTRPLSESLVTGETYTVIYNGTAYDCVVAEIDGEQGMGNVGLLTGTGDTGEPFVFAGATAETIAAGMYGMAVPLDGATSVTLSISKGAGIHTIPPKYLPGYLYSSDTTPLVCLEEVALTFNGYGTGTYITQRFVNPIAEEEIYTINWNGTNYVCTAKAGSNGTLALGEKDVTPFVIDYMPTPVQADETTTVYGIATAYEEVTSVTVTITRTEKIKKIDRKFFDVQDALIVNIDKSENPDCTYEEMVAAFNAGRPIFCRYRPSSTAYDLCAPLAEYTQNTDKFIFYVNESDVQRIKITINQTSECTAETVTEVHYALYLYSPNGTKYEITVSDDGTLTATAG